MNTMTKTMIAGVVLLGAVNMEASAQTKYRVPLSSAYQGINNWFDHNGGINPNGYFLRYDGNTIPKYDGHKGTDFNHSSGGVWAGANGTVIFVKNDCVQGNTICEGGRGNNVRISHPDGRVSVYAHLSQGSIPVVVGQQVLCSALIGNIGNTGDSQGAHLHFSVWSDSTPTNPIDPFGGTYSNGGYSYWVNQNGGLPTGQCQ